MLNPCSQHFCICTGAAAVVAVVGSADVEAVVVVVVVAVGPVAVGELLVAVGMWRG